MVMNLLVAWNAERLFGHLSDLAFNAGLLHGVIPCRVPVLALYNVNFILRSLY
jgi:hypothetical protein